MRGCIVAAILALFGGREVAHAQSLVVIDARRVGVEAAIDQYRETVLGDPNDRLVRTRIHLTIDARVGFDAGMLVIPDRRIAQRTEVTLRVVGGPVTSTITVNAFELDARRVRQLNQKIRLR